MECGFGHIGGIASDKVLEMEEISKKTYRILIIAFLFFIAGGFLFLKSVGVSFLKNGGDGKMKLELWPSGFSGAPIIGSEPLKLNNFPEPSKFKSFAFDPQKNAGKTINVSGACKDFYYTILIFPEGVDYRESPYEARYNTASPCPPGGEFKKSINLSALNLTKGNYYIVRADQGEKSAWYNPH